MKKFLSAAALATFAFAGNALAVTVSSPVTANALAALSVNNDQGMDFGSFVVPSTGGTIDTASAVTGGVTSVTPAQPALFSVTGAADSTVTVTAQATATLFSAAGNTDNVALTASAPTVTLDDTGAGAFDVAGVLTLNGTEAGTDSTTFDVTVEY
ncbi:MAG: DUF4402 domain-containing protein [Rickettsiales bacterium]